MQKTSISIGKIVLRKGRSVAIQRKHPWIFSGAIFRKFYCEEGDIVQVHDENDVFLCQGHYHGSSIAVRILSYQPDPITPSFWSEKIREAYQLREDLGLIRKDNNSYRLIHGEGDLLPGLIIDIYANVAVIQCHTLGMTRHLKEIGQSLQDVFGEKINTIYHKTPNSSDLKGKVEDHFIIGESGPTQIIENGHSFLVEFEQGQKTGFFLDQRENRKLASEFAAGKSFVNLFSYSGGFSVYAAASGATKVTSVDVSEKAINWANKNMEINGFQGKHEGIASDVMTYLKELPDNSQDVMIVDPPAFAKSRKRSHNAIQAYKRLNALAISKMKKDSWIFTFSCSQVIGQQLFQDTITSAAIESGREVQMIRQLSQGGDHPVNIFHPEGKYLKGLMLRV